MKRHIEGRGLAAAIVALLACATWAMATAEPESAKVLENLYGATALPSGQAWRVGAFGLVSHSSDGGRTWHSQPTKTTEHLFSVDFADDRNGWVVGRGGLILATTDGGDSWVTQNSGTKNHLFAVKALGPKEAVAIGDWGAIFHTSDGGQTWKNNSLEEDVILNAMSWPDRQHGWIAGEVGAIYRTEDGGEHWQKQETGSEKTFFGVDFADQQRGWAVGLDGLLMRTTDGGVTWEAVRGNPAVGSLEAMGFLEALKGAGLYAIDVEGDYGLAVGDLGMILVSRDGGATWTQQEDVPEEWRLRWVRGLSLAKGMNGVLVGAHGLTVPVVDGVLKYPGK